MEKGSQVSGESGAFQERLSGPCSIVFCTFSHKLSYLSADLGDVVDVVTKILSLTKTYQQKNNADRKSGLKHIKTYCMI